jgi:hypothetical protein
MFFLSNGVKVSILWDVALSQVSKVTGLPTHEDLTPILLKWRIGWAHTKARKWQMGFNLVFKGLSSYPKLKCQAQIIEYRLKNLMSLIATAYRFKN